MLETENLLLQAAATRAMAARARRLAREVGTAADRERLLHYAEELDERAARLEAQASAGASGRPREVRQEQQQVQQQESPGPTDTPRGQKPFS